MLRRILGPVAAAALAASTGVLLLPAGTAAAVPARAAAMCSSATGVTAVVDFNGLGGSQETAGCDPDGGGRPASEVFGDAGYAISYSQADGMNGFVCKVQGQPTDGDCTATDSFWSLWWSDGKSGKWVFANQGVNTLDVPDGGYVAFSWHEGGGQAQPPGATPAAHPEPSQDPDAGGDEGARGGSRGPRGQDGGGQHGDGGGDTPSESDDPSEEPSASPTDVAGDGKRDGRPGKGDRKRDREKASEDASTSPTDPSSTTTDVGDLVDGPPPEATADEEGSSLPTWITIGLAVLVLGAAAAVPVIRRRAG